VTAQTTESLVPYVFTAEAMLAATDGGEALHWDWPTLSEAFGRVGRDEAPYLLVELWDQLHLGVLAAGINDAWCDAEYPLRCLPASSWWELMELAGVERGRTWLDKGKVRTIRHKLPLTLYRGATEEHRAGWSWTSSLAMAQSFATGGLRGRAQGQVWTAQVEPTRLLARISGRDEDEYLVDTDGLEIVGRG
jgi:hypothetical protein